MSDSIEERTKRRASEIWKREGCPAGGAGPYREVARAEILAKANTTEIQPAAGPHARTHLTNPDATPGAGSLPDGTDRDDIDGGAG